MTGRSTRTPSILFWSIVLGVIFNLLGWVGNNFVLGDLWDQAGAQISHAFAPPWPPLVKEAVTLASDFVYSFALVWIYANARRRTALFALKLAFIVWLAGAAIVYLTLVNSGFLPFEIAAKSSILALIIFLATAPVLNFAFRNQAP